MCDLRNLNAHLSPTKIARKDFLLKIAFWHEMNIGKVNLKDRKINTQDIQGTSFFDSLKYRFAFAVTMNQLMSFIF